MRGRRSNASQVPTAPSQEKDQIPSCWAPLSAPPAVASPSCFGLSWFCLIPTQAFYPLLWTVRTRAGGQDSGLLPPALHDTTMWS